MFPLPPLLEVLMLLRRLVLVMLMLMFLHWLLWMIQTFDVRWIMSWPFRRLKDRFWWMFLMRFVVCERIWHGFDVLHRHLLLMMDFDCLLAFHHKKGVYILRALCFTFWEHFVFVFKGRVFFCWLVLVELFRLYLGASLCTFTFLALATFALFCWDIHDRGSIFFLYVSCFKQLIDLCLWVLHWYMSLLCVIWNQDFILLVFSTHAVMLFV